MYDELEMNQRLFLNFNFPKIIRVIIYHKINRMINKIELTFKLNFKMVKIVKA